MKKNLGTTLLLFFYTAFIWAVVTDDEDSLLMKLQTDIADSSKSDIYNSLAKINSRNNPEKAILYADTAYYFASREDNLEEMAKSFMHKGISHRYLDEYDLALENNYMALELVESMGNKSLIGGCHINIGVVLWISGKLEEARDHYIIARNIMVEINDLKGLSSVNQNIGILYAIDSNYTESKKFFEEAAEQYKEIGDLSGLARTYDNLGLIYELLGQDEKALEYNKKGFEMHSKNGDKYGMISSLTSRGEFFFKRKKYRDAIHWLKIASDSAANTPYLDHKKAIEFSLSMSHESIGNYQEALHHFKEHARYKDSIISADAQSRIQDLESVYENEQKEQEIQLLNKSAELKDLKLSEKEAVIEKDRYLKYGLFLGLFMVLIIAVISIYSYINKRKANEIIYNQKLKVEEKHKEITDSINYAEKIQSALLGNKLEWSKIGKGNFILFIPKDHVSGDFYWCMTDPESNQYAWVAADCTGHGVPGAMMSMLGISLLNEIMRESRIFEPSKVLQLMRTKIIHALENQGDDAQQKDGMDMALCVYDPDHKRLKFSGANNPLWVITPRASIGVESRFIQDEKSGLFLHEVKPSKQPVGLHTGDQKEYQQVEITLEEGDRIYTFSDGFADQFGGDKGKKYKYSLLKKTIFEMTQLSEKEQELKLKEIFDTWKGDLEQIDDVCVIGVRV
ncbi:MAG: tetratricopeptide repeat protein [Crocinitomicaceae bacterium]